MLYTLKFIFNFILCFIIALGAGWLLVQLEFLIRSYTQFGIILHYIGLGIFSIFAGFWGAATTTKR